jgi:prefoldin subunit 5
MTDDRESRPCPECGETCTYDGWGLTHSTGLGIGSCAKGQIRRLTAEVEALNHQIEGWAGDFQIVLAERDEARVEVERLRLTDTEFCDCAEGPYFGAQQCPSLPRCERCHRPADSKRYAAEAEVERLQQKVFLLEKTLQAANEIIQRVRDLCSEGNPLHPTEVLAALDGGQWAR